jgi:hypothetical protein
MNRTENNNLKGFGRFVSVVVISVIMMIVFFAYNGTYAASNSTVLRSPTNASSLEVLPIPLSNVSREEMHFRVGFLQPNTTELQLHVVCSKDFIIIKDGKEVFSASNQTGQPNIPLHSIPGKMDIPLFTYDFQKTGEYTIKIPIFGILFNPIIPEEAEFRFEY